MLQPMRRAAEAHPDSPPPKRHRLSDFGKAKLVAKRLVVVGPTGVGKSTLVNVMAGLRCLQDSSDMLVWRTSDGETARPIFQVGQGAASCTQDISLAEAYWQGDRRRPVVLVDTPGPDDLLKLPVGGPREQLEKNRADELHAKLKALEWVDAFLVLASGERINDATLQVLESLSRKFNDPGEFWRHVIIGLPKCNSFDRGWRPQVTEKKRSMEQFVQRYVEKEFGVDLPMQVVTLGGHEDVLTEHQDAGELEDIWAFMETRPTRLPTGELQLVPGHWAEHLACIRRAAQAEAENDLLQTLSREWPAVVSSILGTSYLLQLRARLPWILSVLLLNVPSTCIDEGVTMFVVVYWWGEGKFLGVPSLTKAWSGIRKVFRSFGQLWNLARPWLFSR